MLFIRFGNDIAKVVLSAGEDFDQRCLPLRRGSKAGAGHEQKARAVIPLGQKGVKGQGAGNTNPVNVFRVLVSQKLLQGIDYALAYVVVGGSYLTTFYNIIRGVEQDGIGVGAANVKTNIHGNLQ